MKRWLGMYVFTAFACGIMSFAQNSPPENKEKQLSADELKRYLEKDGKTFFLDVREPKELEELGTVKGYVNIPLGQLESRLSEIPKDKLIIAA